MIIEASLSACGLVLWEDVQQPCTDFLITDDEEYLNSPKLAHIPSCKHDLEVRYFSDHIKLNMERLCGGVVSEDVGSFPSL